MSYPSYERRKKSLAEEITRSRIGTKLEDYASTHLAEDQALEV